MNGRHRGTREESREQALDSAWSMEMSKLTRDGTAQHVSRDQILRRERGQRIIHFPVQLLTTSRIGNLARL